MGSLLPAGTQQCPQVRESTLPLCTALLSPHPSTGTSPVPQNHRPGPWCLEEQRGFGEYPRGEGSWEPGKASLGFAFLPGTMQANFSSIEGDGCWEEPTMCEHLGHFLVQLEGSRVVETQETQRSRAGTRQIPLSTQHEPTPRWKSVPQPGSETFPSTLGNKIKQNFKKPSLFLELKMCQFVSANRDFSFSPQRMESANIFGCVPADLTLLTSHIP